MENLPVVVLVAMIAALFFRKTSLVTICPLAALVALVLSGSHAPELVARAAPNIATVFVVMSATQLAIRGILQGGAGDRISVKIAVLLAHRWFRRVPATIMLPAVFIPSAMLLAMFLHNIVAILVLTRLALNLCSRYEVRPSITLSGMLIASNLGGASMAFGDTPAIIQRSLWNFSPATFASAMLWRNLIQLCVLVLVACIANWFPGRGKRSDWSDTLKRLRARDSVAAHTQLGNAYRRQLVTGSIALMVFIVLQFVFPTQSLITGASVLLGLLMLTPGDKRQEAYTALGLDAIFVIVSLFVVAASVEHTPMVYQLADYLREHKGSGAIELTAYFLTTAISADGAAATLAPIVHRVSEGSMFSAWQLASGICAGSSTLLTAASAGPIMNSISRNAGCELTFRSYCKFGLAFSVLMISIYLFANMLVSG